ncbi:AMP-binding protein [Pistricoccus aurantiacus]|uniref:AMP-binding protein n=1 Tax=Pistricoccus aurantiacus TaxID=1883414 RepID=A0A5B8SQ05_9GAMM|nr:AMP-binding protein [Pistricoccus aurantiacus]QEA39202.1 AMP-binding protein [Pistricoccus aurantiacus]
MTVQALIKKWAADRGDRTFLLAPENGEQLTFSQLQERAIQVSAHLDAMDCHAGDHVALFMDNGQWTVILLLAIMASGRVVVPLNALAGDGQLEYVLEHCDANVLLSSPQHLERARRLSEKVERSITVIPACPDQGPQWRSTADTTDATLSSIEPDTNALLMYTSGTTGKPKGVLLSHRNVVAGGMNTVEAHALSAEDRALCVLPLYHINAEIVTVIAPLISGGSVVMPHRFSTRSFWELLRDYQCTWFSVVPTIVAYLLERGDTQEFNIRHGSDYAKVRFGRSASSALPATSHQAFEQEFGIPLIETMGLTETAAQILSNPLPPFQSRYGSPGIAYRNEVRVITSNGQEAPRNETGELMVRGDNVMKEYYKNPKATEDTLTQDGWLHTGDLGYQDEEGFFFITGRLKELIIKGGENIAPREIDDVLLKHAAVLEAAAYAEVDKHYGQEVMACVVLKNDKQTSEIELQALCEQELGKYKTPKGIHIVKWLPRGPSGKVQRLKIADMLDELMTEQSTLASQA